MEGLNDTKMGGKRALKQGASSASEVTPQESVPSKTRNRTRIRIFNEAQAEAIRKRIGGLEGFKQTLQIPTRRICELLLIDPSTWTRWRANEDLVPPHSWRAMEWYLGLQEKIPGLNAQYFLVKETGVTSKAVDDLVQAKVSAALSSVDEMLKELRTQSVRVETNETGALSSRSMEQLTELIESALHKINIEKNFPLKSSNFEDASTPIKPTEPTKVNLGNKVLNSELTPSGTVPVPVRKARWWLLSGIFAGMTLGLLTAILFIN